MAHDLVINLYYIIILKNKKKKFFIFTLITFICLNKYIIYINEKIIISEKNRYK